MSKCAFLLFSIKCLLVFPGSATCMNTNPIIDFTYLYTNPINDQKAIQSLNVPHNLGTEKS